MESCALIIRSSRLCGTTMGKLALKNLNTCSHTGILFERKSRAASRGIRNCIILFCPRQYCEFFSVLHYASHSFHGYECGQYLTFVNLAFVMFCRVKFSCLAFFSILCPRPAAALCSHVSQKQYFLIIWQILGTKHAYVCVDRKNKRERKQQHLRHNGLIFLIVPTLFSVCIVSLVCNAPTETNRAWIPSVNAMKKLWAINRTVYLLHYQIKFQHYVGKKKACFDE